MISYGLAFVVGWLFGVAGKVYGGERVSPWSLAPIVWGLTFLVLNLIAGLGVPQIGRAHV